MLRSIHAHGNANGRRIRTISKPPRGGSGKPSTRPPEQTFEEVKYLKHLIQNEIPVRVRLADGEDVSGVIEYYDHSFIRLTRKGAPNLFIFKHDIMYIAEGTLKDARTKRTRTRPAVEAPEPE